MSTSPINPLVAIEGLSEDDSEDLTDEEIDQAVEVGSPLQLAEVVGEHIKKTAGQQLKKHELRRRKPHLFWRVRLESPEEVLVFQVDWLEQLASAPQGDSNG